MDLKMLSSQGFSYTMPFFYGCLFFFLLQHVLLQTDFYVELANVNYVADFDNCQASLWKKKINIKIRQNIMLNLNYIHL